VAPLPSIKANRLQSEVLLATTAQIRQCHLMVWAFFIIFGLFYVDFIFKGNSEYYWPSDPSVSNPQDGLILFFQL
jgi:hypothetical protein